ncbi:MAG: DUF4199 domain-containing protein [Sphingobacteriales bacterium]|nr:MAG: DUF4199 domain-containing protein [Sphingobacteriales bacterium]
MTKIVLTYGLISAAISAIMWTGIALLMRNGDGFNHGMLIGYTSMLVSIFIIYFAIRSYRDNIGGGTVTFGKAFLIGLCISIIFAVFYVITWMILRKTLLPDFVENYLSYKRHELQQSGLTAATISKEMAEAEQMREWFANPWMEAVMVFTEPWPVAIIVSLVSAFILSRKKKIDVGRYGEATT